MFIIYQQAVQENRKIRETQEKIKRAKEAKEKAEREKHARQARQRALVDITTGNYIDSTQVSTCASNNAWRCT